MQQAIGSFEAKTRLSELLGQVEHGSSFTITRRGKPVARLVPIEENQAQRYAVLTKAIREERAKYGMSLGDITALKRKGRKR